MKIDIKPNLYITFCNRITYEVILNYAFATDVYFFTGSSIQEATNMTLAKSGLTYTFPVLYLNAVNTIWIVLAPEAQYTYNYSISFSYYISNTETSPTGVEATVSISIGLEVWQVALIGVAAGLVGFIISCVCARFICKLGIPKHKPWEKNRDFYPEEESGATTRAKGSTYDTYRD